ncbi:MAG: extracellular solute-binding protein [Eubacteriales bacterium]|nr:extracellular solute-binding protein [Eubacteriales bacterium]
MNGHENCLAQMIEERTGVKLEFVLLPSSDASAKLDLMVAAGEKFPDIIHVGAGDTTRLLNYGSAGAILPVEEYYETLGEPLRLRCEAVGKDFDAIVEQLRLTDGHIYTAGFELDNNYNNDYAQSAWINKVWLDNLGLEVPTNYEELYNALAAFRDGDPNGNGETDEIPMMGCSNGWFSDAIKDLQNMFIYANSNSTDFLPFSETDGKLDVCYDKNAYREALKYVNKLVKDGLLSTLSFTQDVTQFNTFMRSNPAQVGFFVAGGAEQRFDGECAAQYVPLEVCSGPEGVQWQTLVTASPYTTAVISADCEHPEIAFLLLHYVYCCYLEGNMDNYDIYYTAAFGKQGENWDYAEEGAMSVYDVPASFHLINNITGSPSNNTWQRFDVFVNIVNPLDLLQESDGRTDTFYLNFHHFCVTFSPEQGSCLLAHERCGVLVDQLTRILKNKKTGKSWPRSSCDTIETDSETTKAAHVRGKDSQTFYARNADSQGKTPPIEIQICLGKEETELWVVSNPDAYDGFEWQGVVRFGGNQEEDVLAVLRQPVDGIMNLTAGPAVPPGADALFDRKNDAQLCFPAKPGYAVIPKQEPIALRWLRRRQRFACGWKKKSLPVPWACAIVPSGRRCTGSFPAVL